MSQKLEKVEGKEETCRSCGTKIFCRMKPASGNFAAKLQWQNENGTAHYNFDGKNTTCNNPTPQMQGESNIKDQSLLQNWSEERTITQINRIHAIEKLVITELSKLDNNLPLAEKVRFYTKLLYR